LDSFSGHDCFEGGGIRAFLTATSVTKDCLVNADLRLDNFFDAIVGDVLTQFEGAFGMKYSRDNYF
jgi:hypothetical protein